MKNANIYVANKTLPPDPLMFLTTKIFEFRVYVSKTANLAQV